MKRLSAIVGVQCTLKGSKRYFNIPDQQGLVRFVDSASSKAKIFLGITAMETIPVNPDISIDFACVLLSLCLSKKGLNLIVCKSSIFSCLINTKYP